MKKVIKSMLMASVIILFTNGCKEETPKPADNNNNGGSNTEQYILMNGMKVKIKNPASGSFKDASSSNNDTIFTWEGNQPAPTFPGDSSIEIRHFEGVKRGINIVNDFPTDFGEVDIVIRYGEIPTDAVTSITVTSGDFKLEKINGIWYSVLKNGAGEASRGTTKFNLSGIEFRVAWPSTFK